MDSEEIEYLRSKGVEALSTVLNKEQNIKVIEKAVFDIGSNDEYLTNIYDIICKINNNDKLLNILTDIKNNKLGWNHTYLEDIIYEEQEQNNFLIKPFEVEEGVIECKCGSSRVYSFAKQTRGADESTTTFAECMACGNNWTYSG